MKNGRYHRTWKSIKQKIFLEMKYDINWLVNLSQTEERIKYLFFWGHQPARDGQITASCLSQWWECEFEEDDLIYRSAEH